MEHVMENLETYGYIVLFFYSLGGGFVALIAAGVLSSMGVLDLWISIAVALAGNILGDMLLFYLGRHNKREIMPYLRKHRRKVALSHLLMKRHGNRIILFQKFVYGLKTLVPLTVGLTRYDFKRFMLYNIIGGVAWALSFGIGSFLAGDFFQKMAARVEESPIIAPIFLLSILALIWLYFNRATRRKKPAKR